jgi:dihydrolipoamide dehydrogenase
MVVGNVPDPADLVVIGAGPGGYAAALHAARAGRKVTLVERDGAAGIGGVCLNTGCIPSKALIEAAELNHRSRHSAHMGVPQVSGAFSLGQFQKWKNDVIGGLTNGVRGLLANAGVEIVAGIAAVTDPNILVISTPDDQARFLQFKGLIIATGSSPIALPGLPFDNDAILDATGLLALTELPNTLAVVGGGYIGLELGTAMAKLGVKVSIVEAQSALLPGLDPSLSQPLMRRLSALGVKVHLNSKAAGHENGQLQLDNDGKGGESVAAAKVLVAIGRSANTAALGLEVFGTKLDKGIIQVGADRRITDRVAAIGDITPGPALAHKASAEAAIAVQALCGERVAFEPAAIPAIVFSDPEIASAGLTLDEAAQAGYDAAAARIPLTASGRAATLGAREGFAQLIHEQGSGAILGAHIASPHASELIAEAVLAIEMGVTVEDLALTIHAHPTLSELSAEAAHLAIGHPLHVSN